MSPTLLSKRLKELEDAGVIAAHASGRPGIVDYKLTQAGEDLREIIMSIGGWGQRWIEASVSLKNLDPSLLMWDMRRNLGPPSLPDRVHHRVFLSRAERGSQIMVARDRGR